MKKVVIDAGHGGTDPGAVVDGLREADLNLAIAAKLHYPLTHVYGYEVLFTRTTDDQVALHQRPTMSNKAAADIFVSIHCNSHHKPGPNGYEVHVWEKTETAVDLALPILHQLDNGTLTLTNRGLKKSNFYVLRTTAMPAVLIECGFLSTNEDRRRLVDRAVQYELANYLARGIRDYFKALEQET